MWFATTCCNSEMFAALRRKVIRLSAGGGGSSYHLVGVNGISRSLFSKANTSAEVTELPENGEQAEDGIEPRAKGSNWNYQTELSALATRLGHEAEALPSLRKALLPEKMRTNAMSSWDRAVTEHSDPSRLAFLGRSVVQFYVCEHLHYTYPVMTGSMLQDLAQALANVDTLNDLAEYTGVTDLVRCGLDKMLLSNAAAVADVFCAVLGAVYHDAGASAAKKVVQDFVLPQLVGKDLEDLVKMEHPRLMLCSILDAQKRLRPQSRLISESGRATHFPSFRVGVYSDSDLLGEGTGTSLRRAEKEAMLTALRSYFMKEVAASSLPSDSYESEEQLREKMCSKLSPETSDDVAV